MAGNAEIQYVDFSGWKYLEGSHFLFYRQPDRCFCPAGGLPPWANRAIAEYDRAVHVILA